MPSTAPIDESMFDDAATEHITLSGDEPEGEIEQDPQGITRRTFFQALIHRNEVRRYSIVDEQFLTVEIKQSRAGNQQYQFNLAFLDPEPHRFSGIAWRWLYVALGLAGLSVIAFVVSTFSGVPLLEQSWLPVNIVLVVTTILALLMFVKQTRFTLTFYSFHGNVPLIELAARNPDRAAVENFITELQQHIEIARTVQWQNKPQFLRDELRLHFRLWEEGVLANDIYEASKVRILREHG